MNLSAPHSLEVIIRVAVLAAVAFYRDVLGTPLMFTRTPKSERCLAQSTHHEPNPLALMCDVALAARPGDGEA